MLTVPVIVLAGVQNYKISEDIFMKIERNHIVTNELEK